MKKRVKHLIHLSVEGRITDRQQAELDGYLKDPENREYLEQAELAEKIIQKGLEEKQREEDWSELINEEDGISDEEIEEDIRNYRPKAGESRNLVEEFERNYHKGRRRKLVQRISLAAAAVLVLAMIVVLPDWGPNPDRLYDKYYQGWEFTRTRSIQDIDPLYIQALNAWQDGDYEQSAKIAGTLTDRDPDNLEARFLYAQSLQKLDYLENAAAEYRILAEEAKGRNE
ncbi:MAG: hypothetical protein ACP5E3_19935, partial [Bacteroidales bacterium]